MNDTLPENRVLVAVGGAASAGVVALLVARCRRLRRRLIDLELDVELAVVRRHQSSARTRQRTHDMVNAFTAIEGAALMMGRDSLGAAEHASLAGVLASGVSRLRALVVDEPPDVPTSLAEIVAAVAADRGGGDRFRLDVAPDLALAAPAAEIDPVIRGLVRYASSRNPSRNVLVRARRHDGRVELWVDGDRSVPSRGRRQRAGASCVVSRRARRARDFQLLGRLAQTIGGEIMISDRPDGLSIGISWPERGG